MIAFVRAVVDPAALTVGFVRAVRDPAALTNLFLRAVVSELVPCMHQQTS